MKNVGLLIFLHSRW